jgi:hypothetical protein
MKNKAVKKHKMVVATFTGPTELIDKSKAKAFKEGRTFSGYIRRLFERDLALNEDSQKAA